MAKFELDPRRIDALKRGEVQWGHQGRHNGVGTKECPKELHHHHDFRCKLPTPLELFTANVKEPDNGWQSRS